MIAPRGERQGLSAARPLLIVGMAPSRNAADLSDPDSAHPAGKTLTRLASYAGVEADELYLLADFANLLPGWPGGAAGSEKWDSQPPKDSWEVGQRAALLYADLLERPRREVVLLGGYVRDALALWLGTSMEGWLGLAAGPGGCALLWSPHPAGTSMWWNDPDNVLAGRGFWQDRARYAATAKVAPRKVPLSVRSRWLIDTLARLGPSWPEACVDWPFLEPAGRPQALYMGQSRPAAQVALLACGLQKPDPSMQALHSCDRGGHCVNPGHLRWGTERENRWDQSDRARGAIGKIGYEGAREILAAYDEFLETTAAARGVSTDAVRGIVEQRSWREENWK